MLLRSWGEPPVILFNQITICNPSGYCGATRRILQIGKMNNPVSSVDAITISFADRFFMRLPPPLSAPLLCWVNIAGRAPGDRRAGRGCRDARVSLHLLVQGRAEIRAVEGVDARFLQLPHDRSCFTAHYADVGKVGAHDGEPVSDAPVLLEI